MRGELAIVLRFTPSMAMIDEREQRRMQRIWLMRLGGGILVAGLLTLAWVLPGLGPARVDREAIAAVELPDAEKVGDWRNEAHALVRAYYEVQLAKGEDGVALAEALRMPMSGTDEAAKEAGVTEGGLTRENDTPIAATEEEIGRESATHEEMAPESIIQGEDATPSSEGDKVEGLAVGVVDLDLSGEPADWLNLAIRLMERVVDSEAAASHAGDREDLKAWITVRDTQRGAELLARSLEREQRAQAAWEAGDSGQARLFQSQALALQEQINNEHARSEARDGLRARQLAERLREWEADPMAQRVAALRKAGEAAEAAGEYAEAARQFERAATLQRDLIQRHRRAPQASAVLLESLETAQLRALAARISIRIEGLVAEAEEALAAGDRQTAGELLEDAMRQQRRLVAQYPKSPQASDRVTEALERKRQEVLSAELGLSIIALEGELDAALRSGDGRLATQLAREFSLKVRELGEDYPESSWVDGEREARALFLRNLLGQLELIQGKLRDGLIEIPGIPGVYLYDREVSQALYEALMEENPSQRVGEAYPVETITWEDARAFTQRVSWLLGQSTKLPSREELRAAAGEVSPSEAMEIAWHARNSDARTHPVASRPRAGSSGFHDLLGNVAEWTREREGDEVWVFGGTARDNAIRLARLPEELSALTERQRFRGFRFVVYEGVEAEVAQGEPEVPYE